MENQTPSMPKSAYDPRWFIWTVVFLIVSGVLLVAVIVLDNPSPTDSEVIANSRAVQHKASIPSMAQNKDIKTE